MAEPGVLQWQQGSGAFDSPGLEPDRRRAQACYLGPQQTELFMPICVTYLLIFAVGVVGTR